MRLENVTVVVLPSSEFLELLVAPLVVALTSPILSDTLYVTSGSTDLSSLSAFEKVAIIDVAVCVSVIEGLIDPVVGGGGGGGGGGVGPDLFFFLVVFGANLLNNPN